MDLKEIQNLIKFVANSGVAEVKLEMDDVKITIRTTLEGNVTETTYVQQLPTQAAIQPAVIPQIAPVVATPEAAPKEDNSKFITIKSPIIGTFYRKPAPDKPVFAEVGSTIAKGDVLCVIEAMKLFNEIESEVSGKIVKILVDDMSPVEFDQPLFLVDPS
ncbi:MULTISPECIES: acetyl-CoA carboxylase biotin carboxyl carrier protein [Flavobacterium]|jgi:acetyl-CoA carboxylase biotin carboxyl carrier protein|uniref:Biotin carboxyl carrier protein of acetyl-CoA carboxylase n=1 Tax=Flavobacterium succinicans TaxID=29536 RepID=A0A199XPS5_9FLAO|nr:MULTISPECIES: acetyl-CoA carboxylase biotin carboxyl carrier protein [Flavobacterium]MBP7396610.1 acetyl-CoA carboxylase biotin carboxyl carrier protein [Flavobacterium sp.]MCZ8229033.1 acetyl-CoA carboxylase biotin carboxyl carrier protein [Flavobacterium sp.]OAZ03650.1 biotin carboxyl carrier protein of acetyl-CoA carboxylase [Flavobacterium succinicans]TAF71591.1 MAG: acetyl-CoA carboxylase biotin carboxyl carrier protein [Flavobacterium sp.]VXB38267.1 Biotin carboxyl carrier protein of 